MPTEGEHEQMTPVKKQNFDEDSRRRRASTISQEAVRETLPVDTL